jgi:transcriptional regulator with XRE-family HTH domain
MVKIELKDPYTIRKAMIIKGYSQSKFAKIINISLPYLNQIINGERFPSAEVAKKIADELDMKFEDIFFINSACKSYQN